MKIKTLLLAIMMTVICSCEEIISFPDSSQLKFEHKDGPDPNLFLVPGLKTGANNGLDWPNAYRTWQDFQNANNNSLPYDVYVMANNHIERKTIKYNGMQGKKFYLNATGNGTELGEKRSWMFGSKQFKANEATFVDGTMYCISYNGNPVLIANDGPSKYGVWKASNPNVNNEFYYQEGTIVALKGASPYTLSGMSPGCYYLDEVNNLLYFDFGEIMTEDDYIEVVTQNIGTEMFDQQHMTGIICRFNIYGHINGTCSDYKMFYSDFSWNAVFGYGTNADPDDGNGGPSLIEACTMNNNGYVGINVGINGERVTFKFCKALNNEVFGIRNRAANDQDRNYFYNCTVSGSKYGFYLGHPNILVNTTMYNNISWGNTIDLYILDSPTTHTIHDYNCYQTKQGNIEFQENDLNLDPELDLDGSISFLSPAYGKGKFNIFKEDSYDVNLFKITQEDGQFIGPVFIGACVNQ